MGPALSFALSYAHGYDVGELGAFEPYGTMTRCPHA